jgi:hypothetical protein
MRIIDGHVHMGCLDDSAPQAYEEIAPLLDDAGVTAAVCFSPVMEIYDRHDPDFQDSRAWQERRQKSREYLRDLRGTPHRIYPFHFVWNDFDTSGLEHYCGIKWHRHPNEPKYHYENPACAKMLDAIREHGFVVLLEEEYANTMRFADEIGKGIPLIIPHLGRNNGGAPRLLSEDFWRRANTWADMSASAVTPEEIRRFLGKYGPERLIFGSDYPFGTPSGSRQKILDLNLSEADQRLIFSENITRLLRNAG